MMVNRLCVLRRCGGLPRPLLSALRLYGAPAASIDGSYTKPVIKTDVPGPKSKVLFSFGPSLTYLNVVFS